MLSNLRTDDHMLHLAGELHGANKKLTRQSSASFAPHSLTIEVIQAHMNREVVLKQLYIAGKPQLRSEIPTFILDTGRREKNDRVLGRTQFDPLLDPIQAGDEIVAELDAPEGATVCIVLSGCIDNEAYIKRLADTGTRVRKTMLAIGERQPGEPGPATVLHNAPLVRNVMVGLDGVSREKRLTVIMQEHPYSIFRPEWLAVSPECAPSYEILELRIGKDSFFVNSSPLAASLFPPMPTTSKEFEQFKKFLRLDAPIVSPGILITLTVRTMPDCDVSKRPIFHAALHGITIET